MLLQLKGAGFPLKGTGFSPYINHAISTRALQLAEQYILGSKKRQGTTSVVPQMQQKSVRALAPEGCFSGFSLTSTARPLGGHRTH
jgi:hypothetical protein